MKILRLFPSCRGGGGWGGVLAKCRSTTFSASGLHSTTKFCQKSTSTKFVNKVNQILVTSTIYNIKSEKSTILTKVGIFSSTNLHIFWSYIYNLQVFQSKNIIYNLQVFDPSDLQSTMKIKAKSTIYNLTSPPPWPVLQNIMTQHSLMHVFLSQIIILLGYIC